MSNYTVKKNATNDLIGTIASYDATSNAIFGCLNSGVVASKLSNCEIKINKDQYFKRYDVPGSYIYVDEDGVVKQTYIKYVLYRNPATIVFWGDGTKTVSKADAKDQYCPESGLAICILKKLSGASEVKDLFIDWTPENEDYSTKNEVRVDLRTLIKKYSKKKKASKKNSK